MYWKKKLKELWRSSNHSESTKGEHRTVEGAAPAAKASGADEPKATPMPKERAEDSPARPPRPIVAETKRKIVLSPLSFAEPKHQHWHRTQYDGLDTDAPRIQMVVGLDFGTSYTKVVLGESRTQYAVPMQHPAPAAQRYLLPGTLQVTDDGVCRIGGNDGARTHNDLKMRLLRRDFSTRTQVLIAAYLALALRHSRGWLMNEKHAIYMGMRFEWFVNVGLPTADALDEELCTVYEHIVRAAWALSGREGPVTLLLAEEALTEPGADEGGDAPEGGGWAWLHPNAVRAFPEFAAEVAAYVRSPMKSEDLHAMIDIGAGTLDVTLFNVVDDGGEYRYPILARAVHPLGTEFLVAERLKHCGTQFEWPLTAQDPVPPAEDMCAALGLTADQLEELDKEFRHRVQRAIAAEFIYTKRHRYSRSAKWREGIPVLVCGGGSHCDFYERALQPLFRQDPSLRASRETLPRPADLDAPGLTDQGLGRLAVAFGLSMDAFDLGELVSPENIEDDRSDTVASESWRTHFVDKDQV